MKKLLILLAAATTLFTACGSKEDTKVTPANPAGTPLAVQAERAFGWGKGRTTTDAYLSVSVSGGQIQTWRSISANDQTTQAKVDIVFPGDWGSNGGPITICSPVETGAGGAAYEYCKNWLRMKGTSFVFLPTSFQRAQFDVTTTVEQVQQIFANNSAASWARDSRQGSSFAIKTEEGKYAIAYITSVTGTYGSTAAKISLIIKVQP